MDFNVIPSYGAVKPTAYPKGHSSGYPTSLLSPILKQVKPALMPSRSNLPFKEGTTNQQKVTFDKKITFKSVDVARTTQFKASTQTAKPHSHNLADEARGIVSTTSELVTSATKDALDKHKNRLAFLYPFLYPAAFLTTGIIGFAATFSLIEKSTSFKFGLYQKLAPITLLMLTAIPFGCRLGCRRMWSVLENKKN